MDISFEVPTIPHNELEKLINNLKVEENKQQEKKKSSKTIGHVKKKKGDIDNTIIFIDFRKNAETSRANFPFSFISTKEEILTDYERLMDLNKTYILVDNTGVIAKFIARALRFLHYKVLIIEDGYMGHLKWVKEKTKSSKDKERKLRDKQRAKTNKKKKA